MLMEDWRRAAGDSCDHWFDRLWTMHNEPSRHYHTAVHLEEMLHYFQLLRDHGYPSLGQQEEQTIRLAIFFHDAVYNSRSSDNEAASARLFQEFAGEVELDDTLTAQVVDYILATQKHAVSETTPIALAFFLDLDMAVLGKTALAYQAYAGLIRSEYRFVPRMVYRHKRAKVLDQFLQQPRIYGTNVFHGALEQQARENIQQEIQALRQGIIYNET